MSYTQRNVVVVVALVAVAALAVVQAHSESNHQHDGAIPEELLHHHHHEKGIPSAPGHACEHDTIRQLPGYGETAEVIDVDYNTPVPRDRHFGALQAAGPQKLRISVFFDQGDCAAGTCGHCQSVGQSVPTFQGVTQTCRDVDILTVAKKSYVVDVLAAAAETFFESVLSTTPVSGNLKVTGTNRCGSTPGTVIPASHATTGVANTDFIVYVTAAPHPDPTSLNVAWASACRRDSINRPTVAHVNFIPAKLTNAVTMDPIALENDKVTAIHEMFHALGFSYPYFGNGYLNEAGTAMVSAATDSGLLTQTNAALGKSVTYIATPRVKKAAQTYFACTTLPGAEIEDQGGSGTKLSHYEKRIYAHDTMAGIASSVFAYHSRLTLSLMEDLGHYAVDYSYANNTMTYGRNKGCPFAMSKCSSLDKATTREYCWDTDNSAEYCTSDFLARGYCDVAASSTAIPSYWQYFTDASLGAQVYHGDYCPTVLPYSNLICTNPLLVPASPNIYGQTFGPSSRCFVGNLISNKYVASSKPSTRCLQTLCVSAGYILITVDGRTVSCPKDGSAGNANINDLKNYVGEIACPSFQDLCVQTSLSLVNVADVVTQAPTSGSSGFTLPNSPTTAAPVAGVYANLTLPPSSQDQNVACEKRTACADSAMLYMPACRVVTAQLIDCFGQSCDSALENYLKVKGITSKCADRSKFAQSCQEGSFGAKELCFLSGATFFGSSLAACGTLFAILLVALF